MRSKRIHIAGLVAGGLVAGGLVVAGLAVAGVNSPVAAGILHARPLFSLTAASGGTVLKASIEHSEVMAPVENDLSPGTVFDPRNLPGVAASKNNNWYKIPSWLAGVWHKENQVDYYRYNYRTRVEDNTAHTILARSNGFWGMQQDGDGNVWEFNPAPYMDTVDGGAETIIQYIRSSTPIEISEKRFVNSTVDTQMRVDKATGKIVSVQTGEQITVYTPVSQEVIKRDTSSKVFDHDGRPVILGRSYTYEKRTGQFQPRDEMGSQNLKDLFRQFLAQNREGR